MKKKIHIAPSILSADFACLKDEIRKVESAGADMLHIDVMDGHFVPNITIGPAVVADIKKVTRLPLDVHLMIEEPFRYAERFIDSGADLITVHVEAITAAQIKKEIKSIKQKKVRPGISLNPKTPLKRIEGFLKYVDFVLVMTVNPGFGGQEFIKEVLPKIKSLRGLFSGDIAVDGGINDKTAQYVIDAGANILVAGSYIFKAPDVKQAIERIRNAAGKCD